jgi:hypothetical protein
MVSGITKALDDPEAQVLDFEARRRQPSCQNRLAARVFRRD